MEEQIKIFNHYAKNFNLKDKNIMNKYHHSFRVMEFCKDIAMSLNLNNYDINIAGLCGLLHDIARFEQWTKYQTYVDLKSFDHGDYGYEILNNNEWIRQFTGDDEIVSIVLDSVRYHNKLSVPPLSERHLLFVNIVRDADKLDIITEQGNEINDESIVLKKCLIHDIYNKTICKNENVQTDTDGILRMLSWVFDFNFEYSYQYLIDKKIIEKKFNLLEMYGKTEEINQLKQFIYERIGEKLC